MKILRLATLAVFLCAGAFACGPKVPPPDFAYDHTANFTNLHTYAWFDDPNWKMPGGFSVVDGRFIDEHIRGAVNANLQKKGLRLVESGDADLYVIYHTDSAGVLSQDKWGVYTWWNMAYVGYAGTKWQKQGSLVLDIRGADKKLVWRGARTALLGSNPDALAKNIDSAVNLLLASFPPSGTEKK
jgi:hypothetical protein